MRYQYLRFPGGKPKAVTLSYDDGIRADLRLAETLDRYGMKCTFNLVGSALRGTGGMTKEEVKECLLEKGHEIAVHGSNHRAEGNLRPIEGIQDVLSCRLELEQRYGMIIRGMAYPDTGITRFSNGASYETVKNYLKELDIAYARTLGGDNNKFELPVDWHAWMPTAHHNNPHVLEYAEEFVNFDYHSENLYISRRFPRLFYLWGHSYEFNNDDNWDHLDKICSILSGKDDTWYATNMEIYTYVNAYRSLIYSADGTKIFNPTIYDFWMEIDKVPYVIRSGETITVE